jgi:hypothetical protein
MRGADMTVRTLRRPNPKTRAATKPVDAEDASTVQHKFAQALSSDVEQTRKRYRLRTKSDAFPYWICSHILEANDTEVLEACAPEGGNDKGIDFLFIDRDESKIVIGQAKYSDDLNVNVRESHANAVLTSLQWLRNPDLLRREGKHDLAELADEFVTATEMGFSTEIWFVYTAPKKLNIERTLTAFNADKARGSDGVRAVHVHLEALTELWGDLNYRPTRIPQVTFKPVDGKHLEFGGDFGKAVVCSLKGSDLRSLYTQHGDKLFERNVRLYLGSKEGSVNSGIEQTLKSDELGNFWAYNNGIAILADSYGIDADSHTITASNISIINGCQTSVSIAKHLPQGADVSVLARISAPAQRSSIISSSSITHRTR